MSAPQRGVALERLLARQRALSSRALRIPTLNERLGALRAWQVARLAHTYNDLQRDPRYAQAVEFFLSDVYGPQDFTRRNRELSRAAAALKRVLPDAFLTVLTGAVELEVLTAVLDRGIALRLAAGPVSSTSYASAYRALGRAAARRRQIELALSIGAELEHLVRHRWTAVALRAAHVPARAAGFGVLQGFLERGFSAFRRMENAQPLLQAIHERETRLMEALLRANPAFDSLLPAEPFVHA
jgi:hypothetical protein